MKKIVATLLCLISISAYSTETDLIFQSQQQESARMLSDYKSGNVSKKQHIKDLIQCSENDNIFCTIYLSSIYLEEKNYLEANPLLLKQSVYNLKSNVGFSSIIRTTANYALGENYMFDQGVLQDFDKALKCFTVGAVNGDKDSVIRISQLYFNKATLSPPGKEFSESFMNGYVYMKIAQSLPGEIKILGQDGNILSPIQLISKMQELDYFKPYLKKADVLAKQICPTIKGCRQ